MEKRDYFRYIRLQYLTVALALSVFVMSGIWLLNFLNQLGTQAANSLANVSSDASTKNTNPGLAVIEQVNPISPLRIEKYVGSVSIDNTPVVMTGEIQAGQTIYLDDSATAILCYQDETRLYLQGPGSLLFKSIANQKTVYLLKANISAKVTPQLPGMPMLIHTHDSQIEVLGTELSVCSKEDLTNLIVTKGRVRMERLLDQKVIEVGAGQQVTTQGIDLMQVVNTSAYNTHWEDEFTDNLSSDYWKLGEWLPEAHDKLGVARFAMRSYDNTYQLATNKFWEKGLFQITPESHLSHTLISVCS